MNLKIAGKPLYLIQRGQRAANIHTIQNIIQLQNSLVHDFTLFQSFGDSAASQPVFPDYNYIIMINPDFKNGNMGYCNNYPVEKALKTGITEKMSETLEISVSKHYTVQVCVNCEKGNLSTSDGQVTFDFWRFHVL